MVRYVVLWMLFAGVYATALGLGAGMSASWVWIDGAVWAAVTGFEALILWNILKYGAEGSGTSQVLRAVFYVVVGTLFVAVAVGAEVLAVWAVSSGMTEGLPSGLTMTIPARVLVTALVYVCFVLLYRYAWRSDDETGEDVVALSGAKVATREGLSAGISADAIAGQAIGVARTASEPIERISVRGGQGKIELICVGDIVYLRAEGDYVAIVTASGQHLKEGTMKYFEENLPAGEFVRVHRSYIVSVSHISRIETSGRDHTLVLRGGAGGSSGGRGGEAIRISDAGYKMLKKMLGL